MTFFKTAFMLISIIILNFSLSGAEKDFEERFHDPLAGQISFEPLDGGTSSFQSHELVRKESKLIFQPVWFIPYLICGVIGFGVIIGGGILIQLSRKGLFFHWATLLGVLLAAGFSGMGIFMLGAFTEKCFELEKGCYIGDETEVPFTDIHALQILKEYRKSTGGGKGRSSSYMAYHLNLVLKDGQRIRVLAHGEDEILRQNAKVIAETLQVPVWDISR